MIHVDNGLFTLQNIETSKHRTEAQICNYNGYHIKERHNEKLDIGYYGSYDLVKVNPLPFCQSHNQN
jgi:hypothetical protein